MKSRIDIRKYLSSDATQALINVGKAIDASSVERSLLELVKVRTSHVNGCAYCIELVTLTFAAAATNAWNRLVTSFRVPVGTYQPQTAHA